LLIVHAGLGKTGTTQIQRALYLLTQEESVRNLNYPNISGAGFGYHAEVGTTSGNANHYTDFPGWNNLDARERWDFALSRAEVGSEGRTSVLSSENLAMLITQEFFWESLSSRPAQNPTVVLYLRGPFSHFLSSYVTRVKFGYSGELEDFVENYLTREEMHTFAVYKHLRKILGFSNTSGVPVHFLHYEKHKGNLLEHFLNEVCQLQLSPDLIQRQQVESINPRLSMHQVEFQRGVNKESLALGRLLGWESTSIVRTLGNTAPHPDSRNVELSKQALDKLRMAFQVLKSQVVDLPGELSDLDCEIDEGNVLETLGIDEKAIRAEIFDLGRFVARSYHDGYISWERRKQNERTN
jgi:hypothetical protein